MRPTDPNILFERIGDVGPIAGAIARVHNFAYAGEAAFRTNDGDEMTRVLRDAELWVARERDDVVGFCVAEPEAADVGSKASRSIRRDRDRALAPRC